MSNTKFELFQELRDIYPKERQITIPIENEYQFNALMTAFDEVDLRWSTDEKASTGQTYYWGDTINMKVKQIVIKIYATLSDCDINYDTFYLMYRHHNVIPDSDFILSFDQFMNLPVISKMNKHYNPPHYNQPQLPLL